MPTPTTKPMVIVIDDNEDIREAIELLLDDIGYPSLLFASAEAALLHIRTLSKSCVILLDLMMPVLNGREFLDQFAMFGLHDKHRVITISATLGNIAQHQAVCDVMAKPFDFVVLEQKLAALAQSLMAEEVAA